MCLETALSSWNDTRAWRSWKIESLSRFLEEKYIDTRKICTSKYEIFCSKVWNSHNRLQKYHRKALHQKKSSLFFRSLLIVNVIFQFCISTANLSCSFNCQIKWMRLIRTLHSLYSRMIALKWDKNATISNSLTNIKTLSYFFIETQKSWNSVKKTRRLICKFSDCFWIKASERSALKNPSCDSIRKFKHDSVHDTIIYEWFCNNFMKEIQMLIYWSVFICQSREICKWICTHSFCLMNWNRKLKWLKTKFLYINFADFKDVIISKMSITI